MLPIRRIVCPLDFSEPSQKALHAAIELATEFRAELVLVHVIPPVAPGIPADPTYAFAGTDGMRRQCGPTLKNSLPARLKTCPRDSTAAR